MISVIVESDDAIDAALEKFYLENELPPGIWFEERRKRYRVRVYRRGRVIHRSYHQNVTDALREYVRAKMLQAWLHANDAKPMTSANRIAAFASNVV